MLILAAEADESVVSGAVDRIAKTIGGSGGEVSNVDRWGRRRFAYEIDHRNEGYYVVATFTAEPSVQVELDRTLTLADEVVRFKVTVKPEPKARREEDGKDRRPRAAAAAPEVQDDQEASPAPA
jgi:small subunit ribosomal protein S6